MCRSRGGEAITAIAGFGQRVGRETNPGVGADDVVDHRFISPTIDVVHQLRAFVAEKLRVLKAPGAFHATNLT